MKIVKKYLVWWLLIFLTVFRYFSSKPVYQNGDTIRITTTISSDPINYGSYQSITAAGLKVYLPAFPEINYGDRVSIEGIVKDKKLQTPKLIFVNSFQGFGSVLRAKIIDFYHNCLPQPISGLVAGVVLGSKGSLSFPFWEKVKNTGVAHVVVASGTNITFVVSFIFSVASVYLKRRKTIFIVILSIILYLFMSGFQPPLIRAAIMATLAFWAQSAGRLVNAWKVLFITAFGMLIAVPEWIRDIGFILSFVSTASIMLFVNKIDKIFKFLPNFFRQGLTTSLAAQIGVAPIIFITFGKFNILSPLINALILWTIPYIMLLGSAGGVVGLIFPLLGKILLYIMYPLGWWFTTVVEFFN